MIASGLLLLPFFDLCSRWGKRSSVCALQRFLAILHGYLIVISKNLLPPKTDHMRNINLVRNDNFLQPSLGYDIAKKLLLGKTSSIASLCFSMIDLRSFFSIPFVYKYSPALVCPTLAEECLQKQLSKHLNERDVERTYDNLLCPLLDS